MLHHFCCGVTSEMLLSKSTNYLKKENIDGVASILSGQPYLLREEAHDCIIKHNTAPIIAALQNLLSLFILFS